MSPAAIAIDSTTSPHIPESDMTPATAPIHTLFSLRGRSVVITGAGRGLGITLAVAVLESGGDAICLDLLPSPSESEWSIISALQKDRGVHASYHQCDITNETAVQQVLASTAEEAKQRGRPIRSLISCAGIQQMKDAIDYPVDGFRKMMDVNVVGSFLVAKETARIIRNSKLTGSIVFIASMSGQIANRVRPPSPPAVRRLS
jgi:NAD(P)-dependent dehydrogenase (short-subunit alcohol dehydrogenase family)